MSDRPSLNPSAGISAATSGRISVKCDGGFLQECVVKLQILLKSDKNIGNFAYGLFLPATLSRFKRALFE